jgi:hypothetical protein
VILDVALNHAFGRPDGKNVDESWWWRLGISNSWKSLF